MVVGTCFGVDHNTSNGLKEFREKMLAREMELEDYIPRDAALRQQIPVLILHHALILWSNWITGQWGKTSKVPFPNLAGLWTAMENLNPWEPTFPAGYTLSTKTAYGGSVIACLSHELAYLVRWPVVDTLAAPTSAATTATAAPTTKA